MTEQVKGNQIPERQDSIQVKILKKSKSTVKAIAAAVTVFSIIGCSTSTATIGAIVGRVLFSPLGALVSNCIN